METTDYKEAYEKEHIKCADLAGRVAELEEKNEELNFKINRIKNNPVWKMSGPLRKVMHYCIRQRDRLKNCGNLRGIWAKIKYKQRERAAMERYGTASFPDEERRRREAETVFPNMVKFSILVPLYNTPREFLTAMLDSVVRQTYGNWELCLADGSEESCAYVGQICQEYQKADQERAGGGRILYQRLESNEGISGNTNRCLAMATGEYIGLFDHDDIIHPSVLYEYAKVINEQGADYIYCDETTFKNNDINKMLTMHFKPDYAIDNLRANNYICHFSVFRRQLLDGDELFRTKYDGSQDHDMIMRLTDAADKICHIPKILYFWRSHKMSTSMNLDSKSYAVAAGRQAVRDAEQRRGYPAEVHSAQICKTHYRLRYEIGAPIVSVMIYAAPQGRDQIARTAAAVEKISAYEKLELLCAASSAELTEAIRQAKGEYLLFLAAGIVPVTPEFTEELLMFAQRRDVGICGMQVLDGKGLIVSSDLVISPLGGNPAIEVNRGIRYDAPGYMGRNYYAHNVSAVSGCACMAKKEEFAKLWEQGSTKGIYARMLEVCFLLRRKDKQIVLNPYALCRITDAGYKEELSAADGQKLKMEYREQIAAGDPFYNKNLSLERPWQKKQETGC